MPDVPWNVVGVSVYRRLVQAFSQLEKDHSNVEPACDIYVERLSVACGDAILNRPNPQAQN